MNQFFTPRSGNKFGSRRSAYRGQIYHSKLEAEDAMWLQSLLDEGKLKNVERQHKIDIKVNGIHIANHYVDFLVTLPDDRQKFVETKGMATSEWRMKCALVRATSELPYLVNPTERELLSWK